MNKINLLLTIILVVALAAVPVMYMAGMQRYSAELKEQFQTQSDQLSQENKTLRQEYDGLLKTALQENNQEWERKHDEFKTKVREALLNSGVSLEMLDAPPKPPKPDLSITQELYESLQKGQSYREVADLIGREGDNILNIEDASGKTSSYEWTWLNKDDKEETLGVTFIDDKLNHKTFSAFEF